MAAQQEAKLHAACDECRTRKLKCSGETPQCNRCDREGIRCIYSPQKQMGRPRKRRRDETDTPTDFYTEPSHGTDPSSNETSSLSSFGLFNPISQADFPELSGFLDFQNNGSTLNQLANPLGTQQHIDSSQTNGHSHVNGQSLDFVVEPTIDPNIDPTIDPTMDPMLDPSIDPSLWNTQPTTSKNDHAMSLPGQPAEFSCTCLSIMYLTLTELQTLPSFAFPAVIPPLRHAMNTASSIIHCEKCPQGTFSTIQNVQSLTALLAAIAERIHRVLFNIEEEAERLERTGEKKPFRVGDNSPATQHLHTGEPDCPMGFNIQLDGKDWKLLAKKALRTEVMGGGSNQTPFTELLNQFEARQHRWHKSDRNLEERKRIFGEHSMCRPGDAQCVRSINHVRTMITQMQWE